MNFQLSYPQNKINIPIQFKASQKRWLLIGFWVIFTVTILGIITAKAPFLSMIAALLIAVMSLLPAYLWCSNRAKGLPLFPILGLSYIPTYSLPLITQDPKVIIYSEQMQLYAAIIVAIFFGVSTMIWMWFVKNEPRTKRQMMVFKSTQIKPFFLTVLFILIVFDISLATGDLWLILPNGIISALKSVMPSMGFLGVVILSYQLGSKALSRIEASIFIILTTILILETTASLYLNTSGTLLLLAMIGWMLGSKKFPWRLFLITFLIISFLHLGKGATRESYWNRNVSITPEKYITLYSDWINNSLTTMKKQHDQEIISGSKKQETEDLTERQSVIHMLLKVISETEKGRPPLYGQTYAIIPELLVPRILNTNKIRGAEANHILSIYYGLQTYEDTLTTSIGWGLLAEAFANFGFLGSPFLGFVIGGIYGWVTRWSMNVPITSYRFLVAIIFFGLSLKAEFTLGSFVAVIFQSTLVMFFFMRNILMKNSHVLPV